MIVALSRALVERAADQQFDVPAPRQHRIGGKIDVDVADQHRRAVVGFKPHAWHPVLDREGHRHGCPRPKFSLFPARGERIEREASSEVHLRSLLARHRVSARRLARPKSAKRSGRQRPQAQSLQAGRIEFAKLSCAGLPDPDLLWVTPSTSPMLARLSRSDGALPTPPAPNERSSTIKTGLASPPRPKIPPKPAAIGSAGSLAF
jgi:hypothetical protein